MAKWRAGQNKTANYGWAAGLGADFLILPNLFLRAEYEYVAFTTIDGIKAGINTARIGAALKF